MGRPANQTEAKPVKVRVLCSLPGVYTLYQPEVGKIYDGHYLPSGRRYNGTQTHSPVCYIDILDKHICLKTGEYEIVGE